jgi:hypothetical protein
LSALRIFIGFEPRERDAYLVAAHTLRRHSSRPLEIEPLVLEHLRWKRLYNRPHSMDAAGRIWDEISRAPMSTEFALTRFLVPHLAGYRGPALFIDCDFMFRADVAELFALFDERLAVQVVQHAQPVDAAVKMDGQIQTAYPRKNWSSCVLWNCEHLAHCGQLERVNRWPGLWLQRFFWLQEEHIGALPLAWNWLEGINFATDLDAVKAVHYTRGIPSMPGYEASTFADEWRAALAAATGLERPKAAAHA